MRRKATSGMLSLSLMLAAAPIILAQTKVKPGFNIFSVQQDVEIGQQSAAEIERQMPVLRDSQTQDYVSRIGERLAAVTPGPQFPYQFKVVNVSDINAFALPGGFMYINRGLIEAAGDEAELAGVMSHEMAHVALRHGTNQASKAYLAQTGLGVLGGLIGGGRTGDIVGAVGGFGLNSVFLKFSRTAEEQADVIGAQIMAKAGYDPMAMSRMFDTLREVSGGDPSRLEQFFSSHPAPADRSRRIQQEAQLIGGYRPVSPVGSFTSIQSKLTRMPKALSMQDLAKNQGQGTTSGGEGDDQSRPTGASGTAPVSVNIPAPSSRLRTFQQRDGLFRIRHPENWQANEAQTGQEVTLLPNGGVVNYGGDQAIIYGVIVSTFDPRGNSNRRFSLDQATERLVSQIQTANQYLRRDRQSARKTSLDGEPALSVSFRGQSPVTGQEERVMLLTRSLSDGRLIYLLGIAPGADYDTMKPAFDRVVTSLIVIE